MSIKKIKPKSPDPYLGKTTGDNTLARFAHVNQLVDQINNSSATSKYKVYTALLTQNGGDSLQTISGGDLTMGVTYMIKDVGGDFTNVGAPNNNINTYFVATATTPNDWGGNTLEFNTGAPVVIVLENTLNATITYKYSGPGSYLIATSDIFPNNKTFVLLANPGESNSGGTAYVLLPDSGTLDVIVIPLQSKDNAGNISDGILLSTSIEIRIYN